MFWLAWLILISVILGYAFTAHGETITYKRPITSYSVPELVTYFADKYQVSGNEMLVTIKGESEFVNGQSNIINSKGVREDSWGIVQIHLPSNPTVTKEQALDQVFSVEFMAKEFSLGHQRKWTVWRDNYL